MIWRACYWPVAALLARNGFGLEQKLKAEREGDVYVTRETGKRSLVGREERKLMRGWPPARNDRRACGGRPAGRPNSLPIL